jgi:hypothetical protein
VCPYWHRWEYKIANCRNYYVEKHFISFVYACFTQSLCRPWYIEVQRYPPTIASIMPQSTYGTYFGNLSQIRSPQPQLRTNASTNVGGGSAHVIMNVRTNPSRFHGSSVPSIKVIKVHSSIVTEGGQSQGLCSSTFLFLTVYSFYYNALRSACLSNCIEESK